MLQFRLVWNLRDFGGILPDIVHVLEVTWGEEDNYTTIGFLLICPPLHRSHLSTFISISRCLCLLGEHIINELKL